MEAALWGLLGTIAGAAASIATTVIASRNAANLQSSAAMLERNEKVRVFQLDTLIELQDAVHDEVRAAVLVYLADEAAFRETGTWGRNLLGEELNNKVLLASRRSLLLAQRVADDGLRDRLKALRALLTEMQMARDIGAAERAHFVAMEMGTSVMEQIGSIVRSLYSSGERSN
ncbi:hypothetical protein [Bordetella genomosp. 6]|uniref:hypothetical protein n=1 Tax=Bordetella genomosp. 6 TaxID=463024 RepID=UPI0012F9DDE3|nr:hypothetical protein [Bordetella genomosp. 6]